MKGKQNKLGLFMLIALVIGNVVGAGIFILPSQLARVGNIGLLSWVFTSFGAILLALVFSKMSLLIPKTGGPYAYAFAGFGEYIGFQTAYYYWISLWCGNAGITITLLGYLRVFFPSLVNPVYNLIVANIIIWSLTFINILGIRRAGVLQVITAVIKFVPFFIIMAFGWLYFHPEYITTNFNVSGKSNFAAFSYAATITFWAYIGLESATVPAGSVINPQRNIPLATIIGTLIAAVIYFVCSLLITGMLPHNLLINSASPFADATKLIFSKSGEVIVSIGAIISCIGTLNGCTLLQGQVPMAAADDKLFPKIFSKRSKANTPIASLIISASLISFMLLFTAKKNLMDQFQTILVITAVMCLLAYLYTSAAEIIILPKNYSAKSLMHLVIAILAMCYTFWAFFGAGKENLYYCLIFVFASLPLYAWAHWRRKPKSG